ncbi:ADYC domain-containing protein [Archangium sp.]|uniref:ADYC domain-containing protein n=1 Tax=Archangium sp. TaxID=1872627 RepID=UPI00286B4F6F|nr:ADYC domain-containing protein [Archangium sp.]
MKTISKHGSGERGNMQWRHLGLLCLAVVVVASGCAGCPVIPESPGTGPVGPLPTNGCFTGGFNSGCVAPKSLVAQLTDCPTGNCDPENPNGQGIYTVEAGNYCFVTLEDQRFCPEGFINAADGLQLELRDRTSPFFMQKRNLVAKYRATPNAPPQEVKPLSLSGDKTQLVLTYSLNGQKATATGSDLSKFTFGIPSLVTGRGDASPLISFEMLLAPAAEAKTDKGLYRYEVKYRDVATNEWKWHCQGDGAKQKSSVVYALPQARVSGLSAYLNRDPAAVTLACETGAIATCMLWGYTPWDAEGKLDDNREYAFRSCLQAKRAAYFVGKGDLKSYTTNGTPIVLRDQYGIKGEDIKNLEAIWSPEGAVCLNMQNRRHPELKIADAFNTTACSPAAWSEKGKLATGPKNLAP